MECNAMVPLEPPSDMTGLNASLYQIVILDSQKWIFVEFLDDTSDIFRCFVQRFHRPADLAGSETVLNCLLCCVEKDNVLCFGLFGTTRRSAENARACNGSNKHPFVPGVAFADSIVLVLKIECCHEKDNTCMAYSRYRKSDKFILFLPNTRRNGVAS